MTRTILVTGATGFLGGRLAQSLAGAGYDVRGLGRNTARGAELIAAGVAFFPVDVLDSAALRSVSRGVDTVVHAAALSTAWASASAYHRVNVDGTSAVLEAAEAAGVRRMVHVSTPAVLSCFADQFDLTEEELVPTAHTSLYGASKAAAERVVSAASGLETVIVRPKAIYGRGDTSLLPRLLEAAARGRLRIVGDGNTVVDLTHVSDVVRALRLIIDCDDVSSVYHVAGPEPVRLWDVIGDLLRRLGIDPPTESISVDRALRVARYLEMAWRGLRLRGEPPLTRYKVAVVGYSQTLDTSRIRRELGYEAQVTVTQGIEEVVRATAQEKPKRSLSGPSASQEPAPVSVSFACAGTVHPPAWLVGHWSLRRAPLPVIVGIIEHPERGVVLFDSGYGRFDPDSRSIWWTLYRWVVQPCPVALADVLAKRGLQPLDVSAVVLSHFDPDHIGGLEELPHSEVICSLTSWEDIAAHRGGSWRRRIPPGALPVDLPGRLRLLDTRNDHVTVDVFGDGSVAVVPLEGHTPGHIGVRVRGRDGTQFFLCGDAVWSLSGLRSKHGGVAGWVARDRAAAAGARRRLAQALRDDPSLVLVPSHSSDAADALLGPEWRDGGAARH